MSEREADMTRLHELLADRATQGLSGRQQDELRVLLGSGEADDTSFDWAAAAVDLPSLLAEGEPLPATLRARVEADAVAWMARAT